MNKLFIQGGFLKRELICGLPYTDKTSLDLRTTVLWTIEGNLTHCDLVRFKNLLEKKVSSGITYWCIKKVISGITYWCICSKCKAAYYGRTSHHFYTRVTEHMGISNFRKRTSHDQQFFQIYTQDHLYPKLIKNRSLS